MTWIVYPNPSSVDPCGEISLLHTFTSNLAQDIRGVPDHPNHSSCSRKSSAKKAIYMTAPGFRSFEWKLVQRDKAIWVVLRFFGTLGGNQEWKSETGLCFELALYDSICYRERKKGYELWKGRISKYFVPFYDDGP